MSSVEVESFSPELIEEAVLLFVQRLAEAIEGDIRSRAHAIAPGEDFASYYANEAMPVFTGEMLRSMRVEPMLGGWSVRIAAPYASKVEDGQAERVTVEGTLDDWVKVRQGRNRAGETMEVFKTPHPFIKPAVDRAMERAGELFQGALEDVAKSKSV